MTDTVAALPVEAPRVEVPRPRSAARRRHDTTLRATGTRSTRHAARNIRRRDAQRDNHPRRDDHRREHHRDRDDGPKVIGLGDHMPEFLRRPVKLPTESE